MLKVISRSTFDLQPVLDSVVETATRLCKADQAAIFRREGNLWRLAANFGFPQEYEDFGKSIGAFPLDMFSKNVSARAVIEPPVVHVEDAAAVPGYGDAAVRLGKQRTSLGVPLLREGEAVGTIILARQRVEPFTDRQIELVTTFADQAVIAMENARLLTEQQEALEQQTATAEVLQVINASPGELTTVFDAMLEKAMRLCGAAFGEFYTFEQEAFQLPRRGLSAEAAQSRRLSTTIQPGTMAWRLKEGASVLHIADLRDEPAYRDSDAQRMALMTRRAPELCSMWPCVRTAPCLGPSCSTEPRSSLSLISRWRYWRISPHRQLSPWRTRGSSPRRVRHWSSRPRPSVLQVINASPGNLVPVFDGDARKSFGSMRRCVRCPLGA